MLPRPYGDFLSTLRPRSLDPHQDQEVFDDSAEQLTDDGDENPGDLNENREGDPNENQEGDGNEHPEDDPSTDPKPPEKKITASFLVSKCLTLASEYFKTVLQPKPWAGHRMGFVSYGASRLLRS
jgi:hypothetical protein